MISRELIRNKVLDLKEVLNDLSSKEEQLEYKHKVPYAHIPEELIEQWADHSRMLGEVEWYRNLFGDAQIKDMEEFDIRISSFSKKYLRNMEDVDEIFNNEGWGEVMDRASTLSRNLSQYLNALLSEYSTEQGN